jgi:hypothetical protein
MSPQTPHDSLTTLLAELPSVRERGFQKRVMYRVHLRELRRRVVFLTAWCCGLAGIVLSLPLERLLVPLQSLTQNTNATWDAIVVDEHFVQSSDWLLQLSQSSLVSAAFAAAFVILIGSYALFSD